LVSQARQAADADRLRENGLYFDRPNVRCWRGTIGTVASISYQEIDFAERTVKENLQREADEELEKLERVLYEEGCFGSPA
jgi:hypothetical protein